MANKSKGFNPYKNCSICKANGVVRKWIIHFAYNRKAKVCVFCIEKLGGVENTRVWLEKNAIYSKNGKLLKFNDEGIKNENK